MKLHSVQLVGATLGRANRMLFYIVDLLDLYEIPYHLEGGTLLGIVRDGQLIPWDHDLDISIMSRSLDQLVDILEKRKSPYRFRIRKKGHEVSVIKVKERWVHYLSELVPFLFRSRNVTLDIFIKYNVQEGTYWYVGGNTMRVETGFYESYEVVNYMGRQFRVPVNYQRYLTEKYGNWKIPVKDWSYLQEKTIVGGCK